MSKAREAKAKDEAETVEMARDWDKAKEKEKSKIYRIDTEAREKADAKSEARIREKPNAVQRAAAEATANIRAMEEAE